MTATSHTTLALDGRAAARHVPLGASVIAFSAGLVWSIGTLTARLAKHSDAWQYLLWRSIGVVVVVEIYGYWSGKGSMIRRCFGGGRTMVIATLGLALSSLGYVYAVKNTTAANAAFLSSITPLITVMFSRFFLGERLNKVTIVALSAAVCGLAITVSGDFQSGNMAGNVSAVFCSIGFAIYTIALRSDPSRDWSPSMAGYAVVLIVVCGSVAA
ncbi:MAG TPA: DMT family transporter, partial [Ilumatobacteraceae bacterium]|nr:DMT family transporter [Ilumatobacteraceae bacterium]